MILKQHTMNNEISPTASVIGKIPLPFYRGFRDIYFNSLVILCKEYDEDVVFNDELYLPLKDGCEVQQDTNERFIRLFKRLFKSLYPGIIRDIKDSGQVAPNVYFCDCDNVFVNIEFCDNWRQSMLTFITAEENRVWLANKIVSDSACRARYDGEISCYCDDWVAEFTNQNVPDVRMIGILIGYMAERADEEFANRVDSVFGEICFADYIGDIRVAPGVMAKPFYEIEVWSKSPGCQELKCDGKVYTDTFQKALHEIYKVYDYYYYTANECTIEVIYVRQRAFDVLKHANECFCQWKYDHGILVEKRLHNQSAFL